MKTKSQIPNFLTLCNLLLGTIAVIGNAYFDYYTILYLMAGCLVADILDGMIARKLGVSGGLGIQLDSLADVVSFGVLPAVIVSKFSLQLPGYEGKYIVAQIFAAMIAVSAGLRLARFNIDTRPREYFWGLPTPAGAILVAAVGWSVFIYQDFEMGQVMHPILCILLPLFLVIFYQVGLKLPGLKSPKNGLITLGVIALLTAGAFLKFGPLGLAMGMVGYVVVGLINLLIKWY